MLTFFQFGQPSRHCFEFFLSKYRGGRHPEKWVSIFWSHFDSSQFFTCISLFWSHFESSLFVTHFKSIRFIASRKKIGTPIPFHGLTLDKSLFHPDNITRKIPVLNLGHPATIDLNSFSQSREVRSNQKNVFHFFNHISIGRWFVTCISLFWTYFISSPFVTSHEKVVPPIRIHRLPLEESLRDPDYIYTI